MFRPCRQILDQPTNKEKRQNYNLPDNVFDDEDDDDDDDDNDDDDDDDGDDDRMSPKLF